MASLNHQSVTLAPGTADNTWSLDNHAQLLGAVQFPGELHLSANGHSLIRLSGSAGSVRIHTLNGGSVIDLLDLVTGQIIVESDIDGQSFFHASSGLVSIGGKVDGQSHVLVRNGGAVGIDGKVDGQSHLYLIVNDVRLGDKVDGQSSIYLQSHNGVISGKEVSGASMVSIYDHPPEYGAVSTNLKNVHNGAQVKRNGVPDLLTWPEHPTPS